MKAGVSLVELLIGCFIMSIVVASGVYSLQPVSVASKRFRLTQKANRLEDEIRRAIFYQGNYSGGDFKVEVNGVVVARHGETRYLNEDLSEAVLDTDPNFNRNNYPLMTRIEMVGTNLIYQIKGSNANTGITTLGARDWTDSASDYVNTHLNYDHSIVSVPTELATSVMQKCKAGIMRGIVKNSSGAYVPVCWEYTTVSQFPEWSIPTGFKLNSATNSIEMTYSKLNKPLCPDMDIALSDGSTETLPFFYSLVSLDLKDLFPTKNAGTALSNSLCERVVDFGIYSGSGLLPASTVSNVDINQNPGTCPSSTLYTLLGSGDCSPNFDPTNVPNRVPAKVSP